jgi:phage gp36-like protein
MVRRALVPSLTLAAAQNPPAQASRTAADFSNDQLQDSINEAATTIDGYIGRIYNVPVAPVVQPINLGSLALPLNSGTTYTSLSITPSLVAATAPATIILSGVNPVNGLPVSQVFTTTANVAVDDATVQIQSTLMSQTIINGATLQLPGTSATTPHPIDYWCRNIAAYNATLVYRGSVDFQDVDPVARRYKDTMAFLQQVAAGKLALLALVENNGLQSVTGAGPAINPYIGTLFTPDEFDLKAPNFDPVYGAQPLPPILFPL